MNKEKKIQEVIDRFELRYIKEGDYDFQFAIAEMRKFARLKALLTEMVADSDGVAGLKLEVRELLK